MWSGALMGNTAREARGDDSSSAGSSPCSTGTNTVCLLAGNMHGPEEPDPVLQYVARRPLRHGGVCSRLREPIRSTRMFMWDGERRSQRSEERRVGKEGRSRVAA